MNLEQIGWTEFFERQLAPGETPGRVASANHGRFLVWTAAGDVDASVSGLLRRNAALWPAVGDWGGIARRCRSHRQSAGEAHQALRKQPEREIREQVLAANIDVLFIVSGLDRDYNERRIERFLVMARGKAARGPWCC